MGVLIGRDNPVEVEKKTTPYGAEIVVAATESKVEVVEDVKAEETPTAEVEQPAEPPVVKRRAKRRGRNGQ